MSTKQSLPAYSSSLLYLTYLIFLPFPAFLTSIHCPRLETSPNSRSGKVNFTVISKTALLCWQKSSQRYISDSEGILKAPFLLSYGAMRRRLDIQTGAFQNERQLNYLPDGVWLKSLICSRNKGSLITLLHLGFFLSIYTLRLTL